mgnify:CR=1 FL=1
MLNDYRQRFGEFQTAIHREEYLFRSGRKAACDKHYFYREYSDLFQLSALAELRTRLAETSAYRETERQSIQRLIAFACEGHLQTRVRELSDEIEAYEAASRITWEGGKVAFSALDGLLANEADAPRRRELAARRADLVQGTKDLRAERWARLHEDVRSQFGEFAPESYLAAQQEWRGVDYQNLAQQASQILEKTESAFANALTPLLARETGLAREDAIPADLDYLQRYARFDHFFASDRLPTVYHQLFADFGFKTDSQDNVTLELNACANQSSAVFCAPIRIPEEIKLVATLSGGQANARDFLRVAGQTQLYAWTSRNLHPEFRFVGDAAVPLAWGFLLESLLREEAWLLSTFGFVENLALRQALGVFKLLSVRKQAALLNYEVAFHDGTLRENAGRRYAESLGEALQVRCDETDHLRAIDDTLASADVLRACAFEAQLSDYLKTQFGSRWWASRKAGEMLIDLWNTGRRYTVEELARQIGLGELDFAWLTTALLGQLHL